MTRLRLALLGASGLITLAGSLLLAPTNGQAAACSNTQCTSTSTCGYGQGSVCSIVRKPEAFVCWTDLCSPPPSP